MQMTINIHSPVAVYVQIQNQIQFAIARGDLQPGDTLPAVQKLGKELGINWNTVVKAYRDLQVLDLISSRHGSLSTVREGAAEKVRERCCQDVVRRLHEVVQEAKAAGMSKKELQGIITATLKADSVLYGDVPNGVMGLAKRRWSAR